MNDNLNDSSGFGNIIVFNNDVPIANRFGNANSGFTFADIDEIRIYQKVLSAQLIQQFRNLTY